MTANAEDPMPPEEPNIPDLNKIKKGPPSLPPLCEGGGTSCGPTAPPKTIQKKTPPSTVAKTTNIQNQSRTSNHTKK